MEIADEIEEKLALLKSTFLSEIITFSENDDFDVTEYLNFDYQIEETLNSPDEIWSYDEEIDVYRKFYVLDMKPYSQVVITLKATSQNPLLVILNFVTRKNLLIERFCKGEKKFKASSH